MVFLNWVLPIALSAVLLVLLFLSFSFTKTKYTSREITMAAVCCAFSYTLYMVSKSFIPSMPFGGQITLFAYLPLCLYAYAFGARKGIIAGIVTALLRLSIGTLYILHPLSFIFDYILGFICIGLTGIFKNTIEKRVTPQSKRFWVYAKERNLAFPAGIVIVALTRYLIGTLSGILFWWDSIKLIDGTKFKPEALNAANFKAIFVYSAFLYNPYILVDMAIVVIAAAVLCATKQTSRLLKIMRPETVQNNPTANNGRDET